jgi:hypothetical protein
MVWAPAWAKTSNLFTPQVATPGAEVNEPPRTSQSLHLGPVGVRDGVGDGVQAGVGNVEAAGALGRSIRKRPVLASSITMLPRIAGNNQRRWVVVITCSTTQQTTGQETSLLGVREAALRPRVVSVCGGYNNHPR